MSSVVRKTTRYDDIIKFKAGRLRSRGLSYPKIYETLKIPKSTLSTWFGKKYPNIYSRKTQLKHLKNIRKLALEAKDEIREKEINEIKLKVNKEVRTFPLRNIGFLKSILAGLYWAEGGKYHSSPVNFANTDPDLIKLFITLFRKCYQLDEKKLRVRLHLHYYHNVGKTRNFWSNLLNIPIAQFGKIYIKKRSKTKRFRKNFMGICFIRYYDNRLRKEIMEIAHLLFEKITEVPIA